MKIKTRGASRIKRRALALALTMVAATVVLPGAASAAPFDGEVTLNCNAVGTLTTWTTDHQLTISPASPEVGDTVTVTYAFDQGPQNGPVPINDLQAKANVSLSGAQSGTLNLVAPQYGSIPAGTPIPGATMSTTFVASAAGPLTATVDIINFESAIFGITIPCDSSTDPAAAPAGPTPITTTVSVTAPSAATLTITGITGQEAGVTAYARAGNTIQFSMSGFAPNDVVAVGMCPVGVTPATFPASCDANEDIAATDASGDGTGSLALLTGNTGGFGTPPNTTQGSRALTVLDSNGDLRAVSMTVLGSPTVSISPGGGGAGTTVTVTGTGFDPLKSVNVGGFVPSGAACPPSCPPIAVSGDAPVLTTANANGSISVPFTVQDPATTFVGAIQGAWSIAGATVFGFAPFSLSSDECIAGCSLSYNLNSTVIAGNLSMSRAPGTSNITLGSVPASTQAQTSSGALPPIEVVDVRGGTNGWSLVGTVTDFTGPGAASIPAGNLAWTPSCDDATGFDATNPSTAVAGSVGALDTTNAATLCSAADEASGTGGVFDADADLDLTVDAFQQAGDYSAVLTITLS